MEEKEFPIVDDIDNSDECPCDTCPNKGWCDEWESRFCCAYCLWCGCAHCADCDPMDI